MTPGQRRALTGPPSPTPPEDPDDGGFMAIAAIVFTATVIAMMGIALAWKD